MSPNFASLSMFFPAWNEEASVGSVVAELFDVIPYADVLVVNDGSTDRTSAVARAAGATVLELPVNLGVGGAMRAGYKYAYRMGYARAVLTAALGHIEREGPALLRELEPTEGEPPTAQAAE